MKYNNTINKNTNVTKYNYKIIGNIFRKRHCKNTNLINNIDNDIYKITFLE